MKNHVCEDDKDVNEAVDTNNYLHFNTLLPVFSLVEKCLMVFTNY